MIPTEQGRRFIEQAARVLEEVDRLTEDAHHARERCAELRVMIPHATYASYAAVDFLKEAAGADQLRIHIREGGSMEALDFVLGSLHNWVGAEENIDLYYTDFSGGLAQCRRALENALDSTWALVTDCPDCYDSLAHIVYPLRYMARDGQALSLADYEERVRDIFTQVARTDHALEVNTNRGQDLEVWPQVLGWFRDCGGRYVTIGSDAHRPQDVAAGIREGTELVRQAGFAGVTTYVRRRPVIHPF